MERKCNNLPPKIYTRFAEIEKTFPSNVNANPLSPPPLNDNNSFADVYSFSV